MFKNRENNCSKNFPKAVFISDNNMRPSPEFKAKLLKRVREKIRVQYAQAQVGETNPESWQWRKYLRIRIPLAAASLVVVLGCLWVFFGHPGTASADFGEMLRQVREALNVAFTATLQTPGESNEQVQVYFTHTGQARQVFPDGKIHIADATTKRYLVLTPSEKRAVYRNFNTQPAYYTEPLDTLHQAANSAGTHIRDEVIQGRGTSVYQLICDEGSMTIWVDQEKQLPVRIQRNLPSNDGAEIVCTLDNFQWDTSIPETQFALDVPEGYSQENTEQEASENDLIFLLQTVAKRNNGIFPKDVQPESVIRMIYQKDDSSAIQSTEDGTFISRSNRNTKEIGRRCFKGLAFIRTLKQTGNWRYVGESVQLDDGESIVCYWSSPDTKTLRAIYGDLTVKELTAEDQENILREYENTSE